VGVSGGAVLIPKRLLERLSASLVVAKEEKRAARRIEQGTGLVDLRHFHLRYRWAICSDADQLAVWGGRNATLVSCFSDLDWRVGAALYVPCGSRVCAYFMLCSLVVGWKIAGERRREKIGCERHGLEKISNPLLALDLVPYCLALDP
jgi:hypothetical protein